MRKPGPDSASLTSRHQSPAGRGESAKETKYRRLAEVAAQDDAERQRGIKLLRVLSGDPHKPYIALTFDDGPHGAKTTELLDLLKWVVVDELQAQRSPGRPIEIDHSVEVVSVAVSL